MAEIKIQKKAPKYRIRGTKNFFEKNLLFEEMDLSAIVPVYLYVSEHIESMERDVEHELDIGRSTIVFSVDHKKIIHLIDCWIGNRKKSRNEIH